MPTPPENLAALLLRSTLTDLLPAEAIGLVGASIDAAWVAKRPDVLEHVHTLATALPRESLPARLSTLLDYFLANLWHDLRSLRAAGSGDTWKWESAETESEVVCLRKALRSEGLLEQPVERVCQIHTNLGNCLNTAGRFIEALSCWRRALVIEPRFGMARGNLAMGLWYYARSAYDPGHAAVLARESWRLLDPELLTALEPGAAEHFASARANIESALAAEVLSRDLDLNDFPLGDSVAERNYRGWCLENGLFLNPLNDLGPHPIAARDIVTAPSIVMKIGEGPRFHGFFNQLKQEYCSARWLVFDALHANGSHFSDRDVLIYNTLDYPCYSLADEKLRLGFRALYSLFDKIAFLLNAYLELGIPERGVSFRSIWYQNQQRKKGTRVEFTSRPNWPLRGMFWLAKDLYEDTPEFRAVMDPDAERLNHVRNHLEHKHLRVHDSLWSGAEPGAAADGLTESIYKDDFIDMTLRLLALSRAALMYLSLGVHAEERARAAARPANAITPPMPLDVWEDDWKR
ncbi:MAG: hypothetical protein KF699_14195 [Phycisphaeraceae bacterium]|nr:hypothetical protein [Phycisphaeraceae bacterium]